MKIRPRLYKSGRMRWWLDFGTTNGKRKQLTYPTEAAAQAALVKAEKDRAKHGSLGLIATSGDLAELATARARLDGIPLMTAVEFYLARRDTITKPTSISSAIADFHLEMIERGRSARTRETMRCSLKPFALAYGHLELHHLTRDQILTALKSNEWSRRTQRGYLGHLRTFLSWAAAQGHLATDPTRGIVIGSDPVADITSLTTDQAEKLLRAELKRIADNPTARSLMGYIALGLFCGLRRAEIEKLRWSDVILSGKAVVISGSTAKTRMRRIVDITPAAAAWIRRDPAHKQGATRICPAAFRDLWIALRRSAGITPWPSNALRHTYAAMHHAMWQDENKLAAQMGNSPIMIHRHYRALKTKAEAIKFWSLRP